MGRRQISSASSLKAGSCIFLLEMLPYIRHLKVKLLLPGRRGALPQLPPLEHHSPFSKTQNVQALLLSLPVGVACVVLHVTNRTLLRVCLCWRGLVKISRFISVLEYGSQLYASISLYPPQQRWESQQMMPKSSGGTGIPGPPAMWWVFSPPQLLTC